jgi:AcrR family transcriptional regulator
MAKNSQLEESIMKAAEELFLQNGFDATSTTDIAKSAGCTQALVHYYYRTKENLFQQIFTQKFQLLISHIHEKNNQVNDLELALRNFVDSYFDTLSKNRQIPFFLIKELIMNEERRQRMRMRMITDAGSLQYYTDWDKLIKSEIAKGNIRPIDTMDLTIDVVSLVVFTFISLPLYSDLFEQNEEEIRAYLQRRKEEVITLILKGLRK